MKYQLHDSQINKLELGEDTITFIFSQGFWTTDEHGKMCEQLKIVKLCMKSIEIMFLLKILLQFGSPKKSGFIKPSL